VHMHSTIRLKSRLLRSGREGVRRKRHALRLCKQLGFFALLFRLAAFWINSPRGKHFDNEVDNQYIQKCAFSAEVGFYSNLTHRSSHSISDCAELFAETKCMNPTRKKFALMIHAGLHVSAALARQWKLYIRNLKRAGFSMDLYLNTRTLSLAFQILRTIDETADVTIELQNRGMDISGFFNSVAASVLKCRQYDIIVKLHDKHDIRFTQQLVGPLFFNVNAVKALVARFEDSATGVVIGGARRNLRKHVFSYGLGELDFFAFTLPIENELLRSLRQYVSLAERFFVAGTMFAIKGDLVFQTFSIDIIKTAKVLMNDDKSLDANWFGLMTRTFEYAGRSRHDPIFAQLPGNSLVNHHHKGFLADAQYEHAWERVLSYIVISANLSSYVLYRSSTVTGSLQTESIANVLRRAGYNELHDKSFCELDAVHPVCLQKALSGGCIILPQVIAAECHTECHCVHSRRALTESSDVGATLRAQLQYFLNILWPHQLSGPFAHVNQASKYFVECLHSNHAARLLSFQRGPVFLKSMWMLHSCSRVIGPDGTQLLISAQGEVIIIDDESQVHSLTNTHPVASDYVEGAIQFRKSDQVCSLIHSTSYRSWGHGITDFNTIISSWTCAEVRFELSIDHKQVAFLSPGAIPHKVWTKPRQVEQY